MTGRSLPPRVTLLLALGARWLLRTSRATRPKRPYRTGRHASRAAISAATSSGRRYDPQRNLTSDPETGYHSEVLVLMELASRLSIHRSKLLFLDAPQAAHRRPSTRAHASASIRRSLRPGPDTWRPQLPVGPMLEGLTGPRAGSNASNGSPASDSSRPKWALTCLPENETGLTSTHRSERIPALGDIRNTNRGSRLQGITPLENPLSSAAV
jgi:hypothetical protein